MTRMNAELRAAELNRNAEPGYSYEAKSKPDGSWMVIGWDTEQNEFYREEGR